MPVERHCATNGRPPSQLGDTSRVQLISLAVPVLAPALARVPKRLSPEKVGSRFLSLRQLWPAKYLQNKENSSRRPLVSPHRIPHFELDGAGRRGTPFDADLACSRSW